MIKETSVVRRLLPLSLLGLAVACSGNIASNVEDRGTGGATPPSSSSGSGTTGGGAGGGGSAPPTGVRWAPARVRRLSAVEIQRSLIDVFAPGKALRLDFASEYYPHHFDNRYDDLTVSVDMMASLQAAAEAVAASAVSSLGSLLLCDVAKTGEAACAQQFIATFGRRVFRRPLVESERDNLMTVFQESRKTADFATSIGTVIEAMVMSPDFLFRSELGAAGAKAGPTRLTGYEVASVLSYFLWRSTPDVALLEAAESGALDSAAGVRAQVTRMLASEKARAGLRDFFAQYLELRAPNALNKPDPMWTASLADAMKADAEALFERVLWSGDATLSALLTSTVATANPELAKLYGASVPVGAATIDLDASRRSGFLTQPAFLAAHTPGSGFSPIFLGLFARRRLFCQSLPAAPASVPDLPREPNLTTRERFAQHSSNPSCQGCHSAMDPVGFSFERYDPLGRYRETETIAGKAVPLTGKGELVGTDVDGPIDGATALAKRAAGSRTVEACFAAHIMEYGLGRPVGARDQRYGIDDETLGSRRAGAKLDELIADLAASDAFLVRDTTSLPGAAR